MKEPKIRPLSVFFYLNVSCEKQQKRYLFHMNVFERHNHLNIQEIEIKRIHLT